jgi:hypothetical protein
VAISLAPSSIAMMARNLTKTHWAYIAAFVGGARKQPPRWYLRNQWSIRRTRFSTYEQRGLTSAFDIKRTCRAPRRMPAHSSKADIGTPTDGVFMSQRPAFTFAGATIFSSTRNSLFLAIRRTKIP